MTTSLHPPTLLLVEDEALIAMSEAKMLRQQGYEVVLAASGEEAIAQVKKASPAIALILMDIDLGRDRMDGTKAAQEILKEHDIPILFLSSHSEREVVEKTERITSYGYVVKGSNVTVLAASIKMAFKLHAAHQALQQEVVERKQAEAALHDEQNRLITILDTVDDPIFVKDNDHRVILANRAFYDIFGLDESAVIGKTLAEHVPPDERTQFLSVDRQVLDTGVPDLREETLTVGNRTRNIITRKTRFVENSGENFLVGSIHDITARKQVEEALRESETKLRAILDHSRDAIGVSIAGIHVFANPAYLKLFGYKSDEELIGRSILDLIVPEERDGVIQNVRNRATGKPTPPTYETRGLRLDGSQFDMEVNVSAYTLNNETYTLVILRDITERKRADNAIRENEALLKTVTDNTPDTILQVDVEGKITYANRLMPGLTWAEVIGSSIYRWVPQAQHHILTKVFENAFTQGESGEYESLGPGPNGEHRVYYVRVRPVRVEGQTRWAIYTATDITERKQAEDKLLENERQQNNLLNKFNTAQHIAKIGSWDWDLPTNQIWWSDESYRIFGVTPAEYVPDFETNGKFLHPDDLTEYEKTFAKCLETGQELDFDVRLITPTGKLKYCNARGQVVYDPHGQPLRFNGVIIDITERKQAETALRASEARYRQILQTAIDGFWVVDAQGHILEANQAWCQQSGYTMDEIRGLTVSDIELIEAPEETRHHIEKIIREGQDRFETQQRRKDGSVMHVEVSATPSPLQDGQVFGFLRDITEHTRAETRLRDEQNRLRAILNTVGDPIFVKDNAHRIILANPAFYEMFGMEATQIIGYTLAESVPENERHHFLAVDRHVLDTGLSDLREETLTVGDFTRHIVTRKTCFTEDSGEKFLVGSIHDITKLRQAEEQQTHILERLNLATRAAGVGIWDWDIQKNALIWDKQMYALYGVHPQDLTGAYEAWLSGVHPDDRAASHATVQQAQLGDSGFDTEFRVVWPNGTVRVLKAMGEVIQDAAGQPMRMVGVNYDITERKRAEDALRQAAADKDMLMHELQHRVKNSLAIIASLVGLEEMNLTDKPVRAVFASTRSRIEAISAMYETLYHSGGIDQINLRYYIQRLVEGLSQSYLPKSGTVTIETDLADIQLDLKRAMPLGIILNELVTNALKYAFPTPRPGGIIRVELAQTTEGIRLVVADNGIGLTPSPTQAGSGMKLVGMLARQLNSQLTIESAQGVTARLILAPI